MAKITLPSIGGGYATTTQLNAAFTQIEDEFQNKVLYRDNTSAESNVMENDIDLNNNDLNNIGNVDCDTITVAGVSLTAQVAAAAASATAAAASAAAAAVSASNASSSASTATASATSATSSASSATASATTATTQASNASTSATNAATSASAASTSASAASTSATNASTSASSASTSATTATTQASNASTSATNAAASATAAAASYDAFDDRYLGSFASAPTVDNDGNPLLTGAIYWNTVASQLYIWTGSAWSAAAFSVSGAVTTFQTSLSGLTPSTGTSGAVTLGGTLGTANGGTGRTTHTAYNVICGGTTTTDAQQSIASVGTVGQVLTSNGASALPSFQTPTSVTPDAVSDQVNSSTGYFDLPAGTTGQRPGSPTSGNIRYNTSTNGFEGYTTAWGSIGGGASAGGAIYENTLTISSSYTLTTSTNGFSVGPITIGSSATVTIPSGSRWLVL